MDDSKELTVTRHLPVKLDAYRKNALGDQLAQHRMEELRVSEHLKQVQQSLRAMITELQKKQNVAASAISQGFEMLEVACVQEVDLERRVMITRRMDTMATVDERVLLPEELKQHQRNQRKP